MKVGCSARDNNRDSLHRDFYPELSSKKGYLYPKDSY